MTALSFIGTPSYDDSDLSKYFVTTTSNTLDHSSAPLTLDDLSRTMNEARESIGIEFTNDTWTLSRDGVNNVNDEREKLAQRILQPKDDPQQAEKAIRQLYDLMGIAMPTIVWNDSPHELLSMETIRTAGKYIPQSLAFRHLTAYAFSTARDVNVNAGNSENSLLRVANLVNQNMLQPRLWQNNVREAPFIATADTMRQASIASLRYGTSWHGNRNYSDDSDWNTIDPILRELAVSTTGFMLSAPIAYLVHLPITLRLNSHQVLDYEHGQAIRWRDGNGLYALKGVQFPLDIYTKLTTHTLDTPEAIGLVDIDQRRVAVSYLKPEAMIKALKAELVNMGTERSYRYYGRRIERLSNGANLALKKKDKPDITTVNRLYKANFAEIDVSGFMRSRPWVTDDIRYFLYYTDPSTGGEHISFCTPAVKEFGEDADACMAWKHHLDKESYMALTIEG